MASSVAWTDPRTGTFDAVAVERYLAGLPQRFPGTDQRPLHALVEALSLG
ncbi:hypothetical protein [Piscinibacter sp.]